MPLASTLVVIHSASGGSQGCWVLSASMRTGLLAIRNPLLWLARFYGRCAGSPHEMAWENVIRAASIAKAVPTLGRGRTSRDEEATGRSLPAAWPPLGTLQPLSGAVWPLPAALQPLPAAYCKEGRPSSLKLTQGWQGALCASRGRE